MKNMRLFLREGKSLEWKLHPDEHEDHEVILRGREKFRVETFRVINNRLKAELLWKKESYSLVAEYFSVFSNMSSKTPSDISEST